MEIYVCLTNSNLNAACIETGLRNTYIKISTLVENNCALGERVHDMNLEAEFNSMVRTILYAMQPLQLPRCTPVSYTHLDVYKRQLCNRSRVVVICVPAQLFVFVRGCCVLCSRTPEDVRQRYGRNVWRLKKREPPRPCLLYTSRCV